MIKSYRRRREKKNSGKRKRRKERRNEQEFEQRGLRRRRGKKLNVVDLDPGVVHAVRKIREKTRKEETILLIVTVPVVAAGPAIPPILQEVIAVIVTHHIPVEVVVEEEVDKDNHGEEVEAIVPVLVAALLSLPFQDQTPDRLLQAKREVEGFPVIGKE